jgi:hypothetical protein
MQNLKAVTMGMVTAIALFWSNKPNPATTSSLVRKWIRRMGKLGILGMSKPILDDANRKRWRTWGNFKSYYVTTATVIVKLKAGRLNQAFSRDRNCNLQEGQNLQEHLIITDPSRLGASDETDLNNGQKSGRVCGPAS